MYFWREIARKMSYWYSKTSFYLLWNVCLNIEVSKYHAMISSISLLKTAFSSRSLSLWSHLASEHFFSAKVGNRTGKKKSQLQP